jgi:hypothetical protein
MQRLGFKSAAVLSACTLLALSSACSFSASSRSSSASSRSSSRSSSGHGGDDNEKDKEKVQEVESSHSGFQEEIAAIAVLYAGSEGTTEDFQRDVSTAAKRNGIPYWELDERVFTAIGIGLERAGIKRGAIPSLPFLQGLRNAARFDAIGNAYSKVK